MRLGANQFSTEMSGTTSTGVLLGGALGFTASLWEIRNLGTVPIRFSLKSTSPTTDDIEMRASIEWEIPITSSLFGVMTTSTSTDGRDVRKVSVRALGW